MFDDFVEHAGSPPPGGPHGAPAAHSLATPVQYQGFEPSPFMDSLDASTNPAVSAPQESPIFDLGYVQFPMPAPLVTMAVSSDIVALGLSNNTVVLILLAPGAKEEPITTIPIPRKPSEFSIHKLFFDPSGRHLLISGLQGENWYLAKGWNKPRPLKGFKFIIESVAWHTRALLSPQSSSGTSSYEILIGARNGTVYEALLHSEDDLFRGQERYLQSVFALPERQPVTGLSFSLYPAQGQTKALVIVTTPTRIYQFVGAPDVNRKGEERDGRMFLSLFAAYRDKHLQITDMPGELEHSELHLFTSIQDASTALLPTTLAWMSAPGIYHGSLNFASTSESLIAGASLLTYPPSYGPPISLLLTEFHFVLLYADRVLALSTLDERVVYEEILPLKPGEVPRALVADPVRKTYWVYTDQTIFELRKENEARDVWRAYLDKEQFDLALKHAKTTAYRDIVLSAQADSLFASGKFFPAAQAYAASSVPFEDVSLKFLSAGERDALRAYLVGRLERTKKTDATQRTLLATWLVEMYLAKCDALDDLVAAQGVAQDVENLRAERALVDEDLRACLDTYRASLDRTTTYELIQAHGRTDIFLHFAGLVGDVEKVLEHHVMEEQWAQAIEVIARQPESEEALELYYRFAPVLLRNAPAQTVDAWLRQPSLDPVRLVPALLQVQHAPSTSTTESDPAVRYLTHAIFERKSTEVALHTLLLTLHASASDPARLLRFLSTAPDDPVRHTPCFDLDYALRLCAVQGSKGAAACAVIYARMGLHADAVDAALRAGDVELAKMHAEKPADAQERKRLWLQVAKYVVQEQKDVKAAMKLIADASASAGAGEGGEEGVLGVEDVLPFFPDFVLIDDFKDEICGALEAHAARLQALRTRLDEAAVAAEAVKKDVRKLRERFVTIDASERCAVCTRGVLLRQFFVFPCMHVLHTDCLIGVAKEYMPQATLRRLVALQDTLIQAQRTALASGAGPMTPGIGIPPTSATRQPTAPVPARTLLSSNLANLNPLALQPASLGRGLRTAGDKLRDLVVPDALAALVAHPLIGVGIGGGNAGGKKDAKGQEEVEKARKELEDMLASTCPLCESVVVGLDRGFVGEDEDESSWAV